MDQGLVPRRYAKALLKQAVEEHSTENVYVLANRLERTFIEVPQLQKTLANPFVSDSEKISIISTAAGAQDSDILFAKFLKLLSTNKRLPLAREIAIAYAELYRKANGIDAVTLTTADQMPDEIINRIRKQFVGNDARKIEFASKVDPTLIGGFTLAIGNSVLDASIKKEFKDLRHNLINK